MPSLHQIFRDKLIPWAEDNLEQRLIVAHPEMKSRELPDGVALSSRKYIGKRVLIRNQRYKGYRLYYAHWPEDGLHELTTPKLVCVTKGTSDYTAGKHIITCGEGHFILLPALVPNLSGGRSHLEGERRKNGYCELFQIQVERSHVYCMFCISEGETVTDITELHCTVNNQQAVDLFGQFLDLAQNNRCPQLQQHLLAAFLWTIYNEIELGYEIYTVFDHPQTSRPDNIDKLKTYLKTNLRHSPTIDKTARHLYLSRRQLTRYLRDKTGQSFVDLLTACRLEESKRYLTDTSWTMEAIAYLVGFKSAAYFNTFFSRHMGCSPGIYRKNNAQIEKTRS